MKALKHSLVALSRLALSAAVWIPQGDAQAQPLPGGNQTGNQRGAYTCAKGSLHDVSDLKGGDLAEHQTGGAPKFTCIAGSKPGGTEGHYTCAGGQGDLHLVSDLEGGDLPEHQVGSPARTCLAGSLPSCAPYFVPSKKPSGGVLAAGDVCMPAPPK
jgi:hypothetical protein